MSHTPLHSRSRPGTVLVYTLVAMIAFAGFVSLAVDVGHVRVVKEQLQVAADAAARYAIAGMQTGGTSAARSNAVSIAAKNTADGTPVVVDPNADVEFGSWDPIARTFTPLSGAAQAGANAVRVTCQRTGARGSSIPLAFAGLIGKSNCDAQASSIATITTGVQGFVGINSISLQSFNIVASYDSTSHAPDRSANWSQGELASNGPITMVNNCFILGNIVLGPAGSLTNGLWFLLTGQKQVLPSPMSYAAASAAPGRSANNNGMIGLSKKGLDPLTVTAGDFNLNTAGDSISIPGGTYYFKNFITAANTTVTFTGPVTLYIDGGNFDMGPSSHINVFNNHPANLRIVQAGSGVFNLPQTDMLPADIYAPGATLQLGNMVMIAGRGVWNQINVVNNGVTGAAFLYDTSLNNSNGSGVISSVQ